MVLNINEVAEAVYRETVSKAQYLDFNTWRKPLVKTMNAIKNACNGDVITISSEDAHAEASMLVQIAVEMAKTGKKVLYFSNMDGYKVALNRMLANEGLVPFCHITEGSLSAAEWKRLAQAASALIGLNIYFAPISANCKDIPKIVEELGAVDFIVVERIDSFFGNRPKPLVQPDVIRAKEIANETGSVIVCGTNGLWGGGERLKCSNKVLEIRLNDNPESENPNLCRLEWEERFTDMQHKNKFDAVWLWDFGAFRDIDCENFAERETE